MLRRLGAFWLTAFAAAPALGQEVAGEAACPPGEVCADVAYWGSWGLISLGALFVLVALMPYRAPGGGTGRGLALLRTLQVRIEKETTGWRRLQWPVLGLFFIGLGLATLLGWR